MLFDAGNTLLQVDCAVVAAQLRTRGHDVTEAAVMEAERRGRVRLDRERAATPRPGGRAGEGRYLRYLLDGLGLWDEGEQRVIAEWRRGFNLPVGLCRLADPEALEALRRLRDAGLISGVISNSNGSVRQALETAGLADHLDFIIDSTVVGMTKPDPRVFQLGLSQAGVTAGQAVYIGDSYFVDVLGARNVGMGAILFDPGRHWGERDCPTAAGLLEAVRLAQAGGTSGDDDMHGR